MAISLLVHFDILIQLVAVISICFYFMLSLGVSHSVALFVVHTEEAQKCLLPGDDDDRHGKSVEQYRTDTRNTYQSC